MDKMAFLFTGQGAHFVGMGKSFHDDYDVARQTFEEANDVLGYDITKLCFEGGLGELSRTENTQPAILIASVVAYRVYMKEIGIAPHFYAGHSFGEYAALTCSGAMKFSDALKIVRERGLLTKEVIDREIGAMTIIDGIDASIVEEECLKLSKEGNIVAINCYNSPKQVAVAGHKEAVEILEERILELDGQITPLINGAPFHNPLMKEVADKLKDHLQAYTFYPFRNAVIANISAKPYENINIIPDNLSNQMVKPVKWQETMGLLQKYGVNLAIEMGPKNVLSKLVKDNAPNIDSYCYGIREDRNSLYERLYKNEQLRKHIPSIVSRSLAIAVATPNKNWDKEEYIKGVVEPYKKIQKMQEELEKQGANPTVDQKKEALNMLRSVFTTKKLPINEQIEWFHQIFEETGTYYDFKEFNIPSA